MGNQVQSCREGATIPRLSSPSPRKKFLVGLCALWIACLPVRLIHAKTPESATDAFSFDQVIRLAEESANKDYQPPKPIPEFLAKLDSQHWEAIRFRTSEEPWSSKSNFHVRFYHLGYLYNRPVKIHLIDSKGVHEFPFSSKQFDYGGNNFAGKISDQLGFAGFVLSYPLNGAHQHDEMLVFLGASYFRAVGRNQILGLSARGIAIDTGSPSGEQFPYFKEFWLEKPAANATSMKLYALLEGKSVTGAYQYVVRPGEQTVTEVDSVLFLRNTVQKFGVAPFSSMFLQGANSAHRFNTLAPQIHNSDGLSIQLQGKGWTWRPLQNPQHLAIQPFQADSLLGFGLMQRDRRFCSYESLSMSYEKRPSAWVTPTGNWGKGQIQLIEIPTNTPHNDNIVAFWVPDSLPDPHKPIRYSYKIAWQGDQMTLPSLGYVANTLVGKGDISPDAEQFNIDFTGEKLVSMLGDGITIQIDMGNGGKTLEQHLIHNPFVKGLRLGFQIKSPGKPIHLKAFLQKDTQAVTETWDYQANPD